MSQDQAVAAFVNGLQQSGKMDDFVSWLMADPAQPASLSQQFQQSAARPVIDTTADVTLDRNVPYATPAAAAAAIAAGPVATATASPKKEERGFMKKAWDAAWAGLKGGAGAGVTLYAIDKAADTDHDWKDYAKTIGAGAVGSAAHNVLTDGQGGGVFQGAATAASIQAYQQLSGDKKITLTNAGVSMVAGGLADWAKDKVVNTVFDFFSPKKAAPQLAPAMN